MNKYEKFPFIEAVNSFSHEITTLINEVPWIPSHGDLHGNNVLVSDDGPYFIDLEHFSYQPFYVDVLTIFMNRQAGKEGMYSAELLKHLLNGQVDDLMDHLVNELNVPYPFSQNRKLYLSAALMSLILTRSRQGGI